MEKWDMETRKYLATSARSPRNILSVTYRLLAKVLNHSVYYIHQQ